MTQTASNIVPFQFELKEVRVVIIDGEAWFVARDVALVLGYSNTQDAVRRHCKRAKPTGGAGNAHPHFLDPQTIIIPQNDVFRMAARSKLPEAERFEEWIFDEVLPTLSRTGSYQLGRTDVAPIPQSFAEALRLAADQQEKIEAQKLELEHARPAVKALDRIAVSDGSLCVTDAAKTLQVSPKQLFAHLRGNGWIYNRPGVTHDIGYQAKIDAGLLEHKTVTYTNRDGSEMTKTQVRVTTKGLARLGKELSPGVGSDPTPSTA